MIMMNNLSFDKGEIEKWGWGNCLEALIPSSGLEIVCLLFFVALTSFILYAIWDDVAVVDLSIPTALAICSLISYAISGIYDYNESSIVDSKNNLQEAAFESIDEQYDLDQSRINNIEHKFDEKDNKVTLNRLIFDYDDLKSSTTYELNFVFDDNGTAQIMKTDTVTDKVIKQFEK